MIRTKLHVLASNVDPNTNTYGRDFEIIKLMLGAASFVIDSDVLDLVKREDCKKSIKALIEADLVRLPYNPMVIEYETHDAVGGTHEFVYLREENGIIYGRPIAMELAKETALCSMFELSAKIAGGQLVVNGGIYEAKRNEPASKVFLHSFAVAVHLALLMLNTKGIEKEVVQIEPSLNKKRIAKGKHPIPTHSVVHIGTIYRRDGSAIKREGSGGWHMPMHWRCGYTRRQHFGKNREEEKVVYIPPCIVNFKPDEDVPHAPMRKVKV